MQEQTSTDFVRGNPKNHKCDEKGAILILHDGVTVPDTKENRQLFVDMEWGWSRSCSICGKAAFKESMFYFDVGRII